MTALTQSGYAVLQAATKIDKSAGIYGVTFPGGILAGDVTTVLLYVAGRWHTEVEPLHAGWCWGWTPKTITGGSGWSNHAGGAAIDINAPAHPQHVQSMNAATQAKIRRIIADCQGVVRWGGDFGTKDLDQMHAEIAPGKAGAPVAALAAKIRAGSVPNVPAPLLTIQEDDMPLSDADIDKVAAATVTKLLATEIATVDAAQANPKNPTGAWTYTVRELWARLIRLTGLTQNDIRQKNAAEAKENSK